VREQTGYAVGQFVADWQAQHATCPTGTTSVIWNPGVSSLEPEIVSIPFAHTDCAPCPVRATCVGTKRPRSLLVRRQPQFAAMMAVKRQLDWLWHALRAARCGFTWPVAAAV
jgi:hypothetical protein